MRAMTKVQSNYRPAGFTERVDFWLIGTVSPMARKELGQRGFTVTDRANPRVEMMN